MLAFTVPVDASDVIRTYHKDGISYTEWREDNGFGWVKVWDSKNAQRGAQTLSGKIIIPLSRNYSDVFYMTKDAHSDGGYFAVHRDGYNREGVVDIHGREIIAPDKYSTTVFLDFDDHPDGGYFYVKRADNNREGAVDIHGREIIPSDKYESVLWYDGKYHAKRADTGEEECIAHPSGNSSKVPSNVPSNTYASTPSNSNNLTYHYTKSGRGQSQNTGQWTDAIGSEECEVTFGDDYITVNGAFQSYVRTSGKWKVYGGTSWGWGGSSSTFYYYVDDYKNMMQVSELVMPYGMDTFVYPMSRNGDPTPQIVNTQSYGNSSTQGSSSTNSNNHSSRPSYNNGSHQDCHVCHGSGVCQTCNGRGYVTNYGVKSDCPNCYLQNMRPTGKCSRCQGTGKVFK